jgi:Flp pilus assembly protein TadB
VTKPERETRRSWWQVATERPSPKGEYLVYGLLFVLVLVVVLLGGSLRVWHLILLVAISARVVFLVLKRRRESVAEPAE